MSSTARVKEVEAHEKRKRRTRHLKMLVLKTLARYGKSSLYRIRKHLKEDHHEQLEHPNILRLARNMQRTKLIAFVGIRGPRKAKFYDITLWGLACSSVAGYLSPEDFYAYLSSRSEAAAAILEIFKPPEDVTKTILQITYALQLPAIGKVDEKSLQEAEKIVIKQFETTLLVSFAHLLYEKRIAKEELERLSEDKRKAVRALMDEYLKTVAEIVETAQGVAIALKEILG